ncbi:MAG: adenylate/guanylate cyclase domain-containing protein [Pseudomonadota bacterium]
MPSPRATRLLTHSARAVGLFLTVLVATAFYFGVPLMDQLELETYDMRLRTLMHPPAVPVVTIVAIDDQSLNVHGRWPWSRQKIADLVKRLDRAGARVIALDIFFSEQENRELLAAIERLEAAGDANTRRLYAPLKQALAADDTLSRAIARSGKVVLSLVFLLGEEDARHVGAAEAEATQRRIRDQAISIVRTRGGGVPTTVREARAVIANLPALQKAGRQAGHINILPDPDGTLRWAPLVMRHRGQFYPSADVQAVRLYLGNPALTLNLASDGVDSLTIGPRAISTDEDGRALIRYYGPERTIPTVSAADVLAGRADPARFRDRVVIVGGTSKGIGDIRVTPHGALFPGVEVRATIIQNLIDGSILRRPGWTLGVDFLVLLIIGLSLAWWLPRTRLPLAAAISGVVFAGYLAIVVVLFRGQGVWLNVVYPSSLLVLMFVSTALMKYFTAEHEKHQIKTAFKYYLAPKVVDLVTENIEQLRLGGEKRELTVLFSDIRGFTTFSETLAPEELVHLLNVYFTRMTEEIFHHDGTLDKYIGDAIMAYYGAPIARADHALAACRTALGMADALAELNREWQRQQKPTFQIGIGINTGPMVFGNMGSNTRFNYTVIGDAVNLGSRIEALNKTYGTTILLSEFTHAQVAAEFAGRVREVDTTRVRGRQEPVRLYELIHDGRYPDLGWLADYERAYRALRAGETKAARQGFQRLAEERNDPVSRYHRQQLGD